MAINAADQKAEQERWRATASLSFAVGLISSLMLFLLQWSLVSFRLPPHLRRSGNQSRRMQDLFQKQHLPPDKWIELHDSLVEILRLLPTTDWKPAIAPSKELADEAERQSIQQLLYGEYISVVPTTTAAIQQIMTKSTWPALQPKELYFLRLMLSGAISFVRSVVVGRVGPPRTIIPFPETDVATVALWLLSEWWFHHGIHEAYQNATTDEVLFHKYFS